MTRHIPEGEHITLARKDKSRKGKTRISKGKELIKDKVKNLHLLLCGNSFQRWPLELRFFSLDTFNLWQESRKKGTIDIPDRIAIHLDKIATEHASEATALGAGPVSLAGVAALDVTYASLKPHLMKSTSMLHNSKAVHCAVCHESLNNAKDLILVCPGDDCDMTSHLSCLAGQFITNHDDPDALIPIEGPCSMCDVKLKWSDLMRDLSLRTRGESAVKLIMKEPRRKNGKLSKEISTASGLVAPAPSVDGVDQQHGRPILGSEVRNEEDSDLDGLYGDEEDEYPQSFVESWDDVDAIADVEIELELESEDEEDLPVVAYQQGADKAEDSAHESNLPKVVPDSEFEEIDEILG